MQYILTIRMNNAASLLESTDYSMAEISAIVGYDNPLYFSRLFKKQKGVSATRLSHCQLVIRFPLSVFSGFST